MTLMTLMTLMNVKQTFPSKTWGLATAAAVLSLLVAHPASAQRRDDSYRPPAEQPYETAPGQRDQSQFGKQGYGGAMPGGVSGSNDYGQPAPPPREQGGYNPQAYGQPVPSGYDAGRGAPPPQDGYGAPYSPPPAYDQAPPSSRGYADDNRNPTRGYYAQGEIADKGRGFFGSISQGLASAIEYTYQKAGRPNGYILGEDGGGAFFAGLRYGEGMLYTKDAGDHKVFWQGPSLGYDIGGEGSKVMVLVYNMSDPSQIYHRFGGVEGSAYLVGGVSVQFQKDNDVTMAVIRSGVGLRLGANVGYLKYSRTPTWNPF